MFHVSALLFGLFSFFTRFNSFPESRCDWILSSLLTCFFNPYVCSAWRLPRTSWVPRRITMRCCHPLVASRLWTPPPSWAPAWGPSLVAPRVLPLWLLCGKDLLQPIRTAEPSLSFSVTRWNNNYTFYMIKMLCATPFHQAYNYYYYWEDLTAHRPAIAHSKVF